MPHSSSRKSYRLDDLPTLKYQLIKIARTELDIICKKFGIKVGGLSKPEVVDKLHAYVNSHQKSSGKSSKGSKKTNEVPRPSAKVDRSQLNKYTKPQLLEICKSRKLNECRMKMIKDELIDLILRHQRSSSARSSAKSSRSSKSSAKSSARSSAKSSRSSKSSRASKKPSKKSSKRGVKLDKMPKKTDHLTRSQLEGYTKPSLLEICQHRGIGCKKNAIKDVVISLILKEQKGSRTTPVKKKTPVKKTPRSSRSRKSSVDVEDLDDMTMQELRKICQGDKDRYKNYSKKTKKADLIAFIKERNGGKRRRTRSNKDYRDIIDKEDAEVVIDKIRKELEKDEDDERLRQTVKQFVKAAKDKDTSPEKLERLTKQMSSLLKKDKKKKNKVLDDSDEEEEYEFQKTPIKSVSPASSPAQSSPESHFQSSPESAQSVSPIVPTSPDSVPSVQPSVKDVPTTPFLTKLEQFGKKEKLMSESCDTYKDEFVRKETGDNLVFEKTPAVSPVTSPETSPFYFPQAPQQEVVSSDEEEESEDESVASEQSSAEELDKTVVEEDDMVRDATQQGYTFRGVIDVDLIKKLKESQLQITGNTFAFSSIPNETSVQSVSILENAIRELRRISTIPVNDL